ncbi:hypothetical protein [Nitrincola sp.]|uniref:hypothetical protein n=1 Tax=Nitrincola sp. TaxID=1926584 RepID=UPI003A90FBEF
MADSNVVLFKPKANLDAEKQVQEFIATTKQITAFDYFENSKGDSIHYPLKWDEDNWGEWVGVGFVKHGVHSSRLRKGAVPLTKEELFNADFIEFSKAYILYTQALKRTQGNKDIEALRALEPSLLKLRGKADITLVDATVLDEAAENLKLFYSAAGAYRAGNKLAALGKFLTTNKLVYKPIIWKNPIPRPFASDNGHRSRKDKANKSLPNPIALNAIAEIFAASPTAHRDICTTSMVALALSQPSRAGELIEVVRDPLIERKTKEGKAELFLAWFGQKGYGFTDKPVPETMAPAVKEAVRRIQEITEGARALARFLEGNPDEFPIHDDIMDLEDQDALLTHTQVCNAIQIKCSRGDLKQWLSYRLKATDINRNPQAYKILDDALAGFVRGGKQNQKDQDTHSLTLRKLNVVLRECLLPRYFPYVSKKRKTKYSEALFCFFEGQLSEDSAYPTRFYNFHVLSNNTLTVDLSSEKADYKNIFQRWEYEGDEYRAKSHQYRHWLDTLAEKGQVGQVERARWAGRLDVSQNRVYNHRTPDDEVKSMRRVGLGSQSTSLAEIVKSNQTVIVSDLGAPGREDRVAHVTIYGYCVHDFAMEPCPKHRDCLGCKKHKCVKGEEEKLRRLKYGRDEVKPQLAKSVQAMENGEYGADRWVVHFTKQLERYNELIEILENPEIEDGAVIALTDDGFSPLKQAIHFRGETKTANSPLLNGSEDKRAQGLKRLKELMRR